jgi:hypothetical protein
MLFLLTHQLLLKFFVLVVCLYQRLKIAVNLLLILQRLLFEIRE